MDVRDIRPGEEVRVRLPHVPLEFIGRIIEKVSSGGGMPVQWVRVYVPTAHGVWMVRPEELSPMNHSARVDPFENEESQR